VSTRGAANGAAFAAGHDGWPRLSRSGESRRTGLAARRELALLGRTSNATAPRPRRLAGAGLAEQLFEQQPQSLVGSAAAEVMLGASENERLRENA
jgi:hypothetical protein